MMLGRGALVAWFFTVLLIAGCGGHTNASIRDEPSEEGGTADAGAASDAKAEAMGSPCGDHAVRTAMGCLSMLTCCWTPESLAVGPESFYWTTHDVLYKTPLTGMVWEPTVEDPVTLFSGSYRPVALTIDDDSAYLTSSVDGVVRVPLSGGDATVLLDEGLDSGAIAVAGNNVCWTDGNYGGSVKCVSTDGGSVANLVTGEPYPGAVAVDATHVYWLTTGSPRGTGAVRRIALAGGTAETLVSGLGSPKDLAIDAAFVYWTNLDDGTVMKVPLAGGDPTTLVSDQFQPGAIAVDADALYWANGFLSFDTAAGSVMKLAFDSGLPQELVGAQYGPRDLNVDGTSVYWITWGAPDAWGVNAVMRLEPK
jgi:hypothetical protein